MRIAVSNIAWTATEDEDVERSLFEAGVDALEAAPSRLFADPDLVSDSEIDGIRKRLGSRRLDLVAFQSLLFGRPDATLFGAAGERRAFVERLTAMIVLAERMVVPRLVLGSPRNRRLAPGMSVADAVAVAVPVFVQLAERAQEAGTELCIEPNPAQYGCDFVTTPEEGMALVEAVDAPGFGLHLDTAGAVLAGADPVAAIERWGPLIRHLHVSAPDLGEIEDDIVPHHEIAGALRRSGYTGVVSIEMRSAGVADDAERVRRAITRTRRHYAG